MNKFYINSNKIRNGLLDDFDKAIEYFDEAIRVCNNNNHASNVGDKLRHYKETCNRIKNFWSCVVLIKFFYPTIFKINCIYQV